MYSGISSGAREKERAGHEVHALPRRVCVGSGVGVGGGECTERTQVDRYRVRGGGGRDEGRERGGREEETEGEGGEREGGRVIEEVKDRT